MASSAHSDTTEDFQRWIEQVIVPLSEMRSDIKHLAEAVNRTSTIEPRVVALETVVKEHEKQARRQDIVNRFVISLAVGSIISVLGMVLSAVIFIVPYLLKR